MPSSVAHFWVELPDKLSVLRLSWQSLVFNGGGTISIARTNVPRAKRKRPRCREKTRSFHCLVSDDPGSCLATRSVAAETHCASWPTREQRIFSRRGG